MTGPRLNPNLLKVPLYIAGRSIGEIKEELGLDEVIKMASNESPIGASPLALEAAREMLPEAHRYPGITERNLRAKLAARHGRGLAVENILIGNGGTDVLRMITQAFIFDGGNAVMSRATFPMYRILTTTFGGEPRKVEPAPGNGHDLAEMAARIDEDTRLVFLCSPNNPTGHVISQAEADAFMEQVPEHVVVVFDEAYYDYVTNPDYADSLEYVRAGRHVITLRSFSKTAGLANMRVGYMIAPAGLSDYVHRARLPFHTGDIALAAASASLDDVEFRARHREAVLQGRAYLYDSFRSMGLTCLPSQSNFVAIIDPPIEPAILAEGLLRRGFIIRAMTAFGMPNAIRVSVGTVEENEKFVVALEEMLRAPLDSRPLSG